MNNKFLIYSLTVLTLTTLSLLILHNTNAERGPVTEGGRALSDKSSMQLNRADSTIKAIYSCFSVSGTKLFRETYQIEENSTTELRHDKKHEYSYLWRFSGVLSAVTALASGNDEYVGLLENDILPGLNEYFDSCRVPAAYSSYIVSADEVDRYYDDNIWVGIDYVNLYQITGKKDYLDKAKLIWKFIESGMDNVLGGGVYWCEQTKSTKNTCSNAPAAVFALKLFKATKDAYYLKKGQELYEWTRKNLMDSEDGLYFDNISVDGHVDKRKYSYNSGQMMQAAALLYKFTQKRNFIKDARNLAASCTERFLAPKVINGEKTLILKDGNVWFNAMMLS